MEIVSFVSFKGGAGKTTALEILCSAILARGRPVALIESDENAPLGQWRTNARKEETWDEACKIYPGGSPQLLLESIVAAEASGVDYLLIDTQGGGSELNNAAIVNSSLVIVPTAITSADIPRCIDTLAFLDELRRAENLESTLLIAILVTRFPLNLNKSRQESLDKLADFPLFQTIIRERDALAGIEDTGMLHLALSKRAAISPILATHFRSAMKEAMQLADEITSILDPGDALPQRNEGSYAARR